MVLHNHRWHNLCGTSKVLKTSHNSPPKGIEPTNRKPLKTRVVKKRTPSDPVMSFLKLHLSEYPELPQSHDAFRDMVVTTSSGQKLDVNTKVSPYLLAGATKRWELDAQGYVPQPGETFRLTTHGIAGVIDEQIGVADTP